MAEQPAGTTRPFGVAGRVGVTLAATLLLTIIVTAAGGAMSSDTTTMTAASTVAPPPSAVQTTLPWQTQAVVESLKECGSAEKDQSVDVTIENDASQNAPAEVKTNDGDCDFRFCVTTSSLKKGTGQLRIRDDEAVFDAGDPKQEVKISISDVAICEDQVNWDGSISPGNQDSVGASLLSRLGVCASSEQNARLSQYRDSQDIVVEMNVPGNTDCSLRFCVNEPKLQNQDNAKIESIGSKIVFKVNGNTSIPVSKLTVCPDQNLFKP